VPTNDANPTTPERAHRRVATSLRIAAVVVGAGVIAAACGSSSPSATKKTSGSHTEASGSKKHKSTTTTTSGPGTTTTTAAAAGATTTTVAGTKTTPTTAKGTTTPTTAAAASTPGGSLSSNTTSSPAATLTGIGASSIQPFYGKVLYQYNQLNHGVSVNFTGSGSGPGVTAIEQNTANFGQSEVPMTSAQLAASKGPVLQVPVDLGGVAVSYHVSGVSGLKLNGPVLADIYLRKITNWNDPAIAALNPGLTLPNENIVPVFRSDTSGPGYDLDQYLIDTSTDWTGAIGATAPSTTWPTAGRATGDSGEDLNAGVASYIQETEGAIGYVEYSYALEANFSNAALLNKSGSYVTPSVGSIAAAGATATGLSSTNFNIIYSAGGSVYPLANFSWALIYQKQTTTNTGIVLGKLFQWVTTSGQSYSSGLGYAPLPSTAVSLAHSTLLGLQTATGSPIFSS
jgi:phosphate transport system substrate-binding protein